MTPSARRRHLQALGVLDQDGELTPYGEGWAEEWYGMGVWGRGEEPSTKAEEEVGEHD